MTRAEFINVLKIAGLVSLTFGSSAIYGLDISPRNLETESPSLYDLDYIERLTEEISNEASPPFITVENGHASFLKFHITNNPLIREVFVRTMNDMLSRQPDTNDINDIIDFALSCSMQVLGELEGFEQLDEYTRTMHTMTIFSYCMGGVFGKWFKLEELEEMGIALPMDIVEEELHKGIKGQNTLWRFFPGILKAEPSFERVGDIDRTNFDHYLDLMAFSGKDRMAHYWSHYFLSFNCAKLLQAQSPLLRVPNAVKVFMHLDGDSPQDVGVSLAWLAGRAWEFHQTIESIGVDADFPKGILDPLHRLDYMANEAGARSAAKFFKHLVQNKDFPFSTQLMYFKGNFMKIFKALDKTVAKLHKGPFDIYWSEILVD